MRIVAVLVTASLGLGPGLLAPAATAPASPVPTPIKLKIAKNAAHVISFGRVWGVARGDRLVATLISVEQDGNRVLDKQRVRFGRGKTIRWFDLRLERPETGWCRVRVAHRRSGRVLQRVVRELSCHRPAFELGRASLVPSSGPTVVIDAFLAETSEQHSYGLSFRRRLAADRGMAFVFQSDQSGAFWMKDTLIPLSIAYYDSSGTIRRILDMEPCPQDAPDCPVYDPGVVYRGALEVNKGAFELWGIAEGDRILVTRRI